MYFNCDLPIEIENGQFEIWKKKLEICVGKVGIFDKKKCKSGEKLKLGKIVEKFWKFKNIYIFGNYSEICKKKSGNNLEFWETFGMLDKFQNFEKFWNLEIKFET